MNMHDCLLMVLSTGSGFIIAEIGIAIFKKMALKQVYQELDGEHKRCKHCGEFFK